MIPGRADGTARRGRHWEPERGEAKLGSIGEHPSPRWEGSAWPSGSQLHPPTSSLPLLHGMHSLVLI